MMNENYIELSAGDASNVALVSPTTTPYQYQPLEFHDSIRILELLPGRIDDTIRIKLHHRSISDLPACEALSYEWGAPVFDHTIICSDGILNVTKNLFAALRRIRFDHKARFLWIDAICIDQCETSERSHQVKLMADIYQKVSQVLIWIGEEGPYTKEAFEQIQFLALIGADLNPNTIYRTVSDLPESVGKYSRQLNALTLSISWTGLKDLFTCRSYFERLWVVQEIVLAPHALLVCGGQEVDWYSFSSASRVFALCLFLDGSLYGKHLVATWSCVNLHRDLRNQHDLSVLDILLGTSFHKCYDPRDRVYSMLGMINNQLKEMITINYNWTIGEVFQDVARCLIIVEQSLDLWRWATLEPSSRLDVGEMASWAPSFINDPYFPRGASPIIRSFLGKSKRLTIDGDVLAMYGFFLDEVDKSFESFTPHNVGSVIFEADTVLTERQAYSTNEMSYIALLHSLVIPDHRMSQQECIKIEQGFWAFWFLIWTKNLSREGLTSTDINLDGLKPRTVPNLGQECTSIGITKMEDAEYVPSKANDHESNHPDVAGPATMPTIITEFMQMRTSYSNKSPQNIQILKGLQSFYQELFARRHEMQAATNFFLTRMLRQVCGIRGGQGFKFGRNLFRGSQGYWGTGPGVIASKIDTSPPAVQVGDFIAIIPHHDRPVILRPRDDGCYTLIGTAYIGLLEQAPCFKEGNEPELIQIRIR